MTKKLRIILPIAILTLILGVAGWHFFIQTYHFSIVQPDVLYRDGLQGMRRFRNAYRWHPFKTVINLQSEENVGGKYKQQFDEEQQFCAENHIRFFRIPILDKTAPTPKQIAEFLKIASDPANQPVLMHDSQGVVREGMLVAVWQIEKMGYSNERCLKEALFLDHAKGDVLETFIREYKKR